MPEYCASSDIKNRLTQVGMLKVFDRNGDGVADPTEEAMYITPAIQYGGNLIDGYLCGQLNPAAARGASNPWLRDRCVDLAVYQACLIGARDVPKSVESAKDFTLTLLSGIMRGDRIPGYPYPGPANAKYQSRGPKVANLGRAQRIGSERSRGNWPNY